MITDPLSNMLTQIKNGGLAGKPAVIVPHSDLKARIAETLAKAGFLGRVTLKGKKVKRWLELELAYKDNQPAIHNLKRLSKPSRRVYKNYRELRPVRQGQGMEILSTPKGILTNREAKKEKVGGEVLFSIW